MNAPRKTSVRRRLRRLLSALCAIGLMWPIFAVANGDGLRTGTGSVIHVGASDEVMSRSVDLSIGRSLIVDLPRDGHAGQHKRGHAVEGLALAARVLGQHPAPEVNAFRGIGGRNRAPDAAIRARDEGFTSGE